jgi:hypothetical protein
VFTDVGSVGEQGLPLIHSDNAATSRKMQPAHKEIRQPHASAFPSRNGVA